MAWAAIADISAFSLPANDHDSGTTRATNKQAAEQI
jgi:hypothetical protein